MKLDAAKVVTLFRDHGMTVKELQERYGVRNPKRITAVLRAAGIDVKAVSNKRGHDA